jgi:tetratricopeptide (TPR) repeat protein
MLDQNQKALTYFDKAILDKDNIIVNKNNKMAFRGKGIAYFKSYHYMEAIEQFDKALAIDELRDSNMYILYYKGNSQEKAGLYDKAIETYSTILTKNSSDAAIYNNRAFMYQKLGDYNKSLADYDKAISLDKVKYDYYFGKYFLLLESADAAGAATVLDEAASITVKTQEDKFNLAKIHYYMEDYESAIIELSEAFRNGFSVAYFFLGDIYEKKGDYESAIHNYQMYIDDKTNVKSAAVYNQIGVCLIKSNRYEEALADIQIGLGYNDVLFEKSLKRNEIVAYEKLSKFEEAYPLMTEFLASYPEDEEAFREYEFIKTRLPEVSTVTKTEE